MSRRSIFADGKIAIFRGVLFSRMTEFQKFHGVLFSRITISTWGFVLASGVGIYGNLPYAWGRRGVLERIEPCILLKKNLIIFKLFTKIFAEFYFRGWQNLKNFAEFYFCGLAENPRKLISLRLVPYLSKRARSIKWAAIYRV